MTITTEQALKTELAAPLPRSLYLLFGDEPVLLSSCRRRVLARLSREKISLERIDAKAPDIGLVAEGLSLVPMLGGRRVISLEGLEPEQLSERDCAALCALMQDIPEDSCLVVTAKEGCFDPKKGPRAKKLLASADREGAVVALPRRTGETLKAMLRRRCREKGGELPAAAADSLIARCGDDPGTLLNECDKLCAYAGKSPITEEMIALVCTPSVEGDAFALSRLILRGDASKVLREIDALIFRREPVPLLLYHLSAAFCELARAAAARAAGKDCAQAARDFDSRLVWRLERAFRDSERIAPERIFSVCEILLEAEQALKSSAADERVTLEAAAVRAMAALSGERLC